MKEKIRNLIKVENYFILIIGIIVASPLMVKGGIIAHDAVYPISRTIGTVLGLKQGQFLPYITSNFANGLGYCWNLFYPPISTYGIIFFRIFTDSYVNSMKIFIAITIILSGLFMYHFVYDVTKNKMTSLLAAIIYITAPYRLTDIYIRMAIGEIVSFVFVPLVFHGLYSILEEDCKKHWYLVIGAVGLALTHNISTLLTVIPSIIYVLFNIKKLLNKNIIKTLIIDVIFILGMICFFYGPMMEAKMSCDYAVFEDGKMGSLSQMHQNSVYIYQLIFGKMQRGISAGLEDSDNINKDMCFALGLQILIPIIFTPVIYKKIDINKRKIYILTLVTGLLVLFATTNIFPWKYMPSIFAYIQFPYRFLFIAIFLLSIISAINIEKLFEELKFKDVFIITLLILIYIEPLINVAQMDYFYNENKYTELDYVYENTENTDCCAYFEYLPAKVKIPYLANRSQDAIILSGETHIIEQEKENDRMTIKIEDTTKDTQIEIPYVYYVGYTATLNGRKLQINESENGFVSVIVEQGMNGEIQIKYTGTIIQKITMTISIFTVIMFIVYVVYYKRKYKEIGEKLDEE